LDGLLDGGIPRGRTTLISGKSGAGKTSIAVQMLATLARTEGLRGVYVCVEERPEDVVAGGDSLGLGLSELVQQKQVALLDLRPPIGERTELAGESSLDATIALIATSAQKNGAKLVVIDSITSLLLPKLGADEMRRNTLLLVTALEERGFTVLLTANAPTDYARPTIQGSEDAAMLVLVVRNAVDDTRRRRTLEVYKYRRSNHRKGEYPFTVSADGVVIFPVELPDGHRRERTAGSERFSSGLAGLDQMNHGGWLRDSIVLVRGPSGSGKTTLAGMYACAGAERGERIAYYGFEEPREVLLRNFARLGMRIDEYARSQDVRVVCRYPEATSAEDLLSELRRDLDQRKPSLVVVDSISSIEHASSQRGFRDFLIGLASLLRSYNRSALLTQTIGAQREGSQDCAPYLSTVADAILSLDYSVDQPTMRRTIRVLKMRGSAHSLDQWSLRIACDGLHVEPSAG
jgi:circadian clock protein KaiC